MIFISYSRDDAAVVSRIRNELELRGHRIWRDTDEILGTTSWPHRIEGALRACERLVLVKSATSSRSRHVHAEWFFFYEHQKPLHIVRLDDSAPPYQLLPYQHIDATDDLEVAINELDRQLRSPFHFPANTPEVGAAETTVDENQTLVDILRREGVGALDEAAISRFLGRTPTTIEQYLATRIIRAVRQGLSSELLPDIELVTDEREISEAWPTNRSAMRFDSPLRLFDETSFPALVIVAEPGGGKSSVLRSLEIGLASRTLRDARGYVPFCISLSELTLQSGLKDFDFAAWLEGRWRVRCPRLPPLSAFSAEGRVVFFLDGLNEVSVEGPRIYLEFCRWLRTWLTDTCPAGAGNRAIFACRTLDYADLLSSKEHVVPTAVLLPLPRERVDRYIGHRVPDLDFTEFEERLPDVAKVLCTPFFLVGFCEVVRARRRIPESRSEIIDGMLRLALRREVLADNPLFLPGDLLSEGQWRELRSGTTAHVADGGWRSSRLVMAWANGAATMQRSRPGLEQGQIVATVQTMISALQQPDEVARVCYKAACDAGVLVEQDGKARFYHQLFQEYLASLEFCRQPDWWQLDQTPFLESGRETLGQALADARGVDESLPPVPLTGWEMTAAFALDQRWTDDGFWRNLLETNPILAFRIASERAPIHHQRVTEAAGILVRLYSDHSVDLRARVAIGDLLGDTWDIHRIPPPVSQGWVSVPAGRYVVGCDSSQYSQERPQRKITLGAFEVSRYPVTNLEYSAFVDAGGYEDVRWWSDVGDQAWLKGTARLDPILSFWLERWRRVQQRPRLALDVLRDGRASVSQAASIVRLGEMSASELEQAVEAWFASEVKHGPRFWRHPVLGSAYSPVVGVSWHEARAYTAWRSVQDADASIRLPTEWEWEAAAAGQAGWTYATGHEFVPTAMNTAELRLGRTTPVGLFNDCASWCGAFELSGNIFEWTSSFFRGQEGDPVVHRGGSWRHSAVRARAAYRGRGMAYARNDDVGFRLARSAS